MNFQFYGYTVRTSSEEDIWIARAMRIAPWDFAFFCNQGGGRESFIVFQNDPDVWQKHPLAFFQIEHIAHDVRLHWQTCPDASPKHLLRGLIKLVPLIEKALALSGVRAIFFTSHSLTMVSFMEKRLGYELQPDIDGGEDGVVMTKVLDQSNWTPSVSVPVRLPSGVQ